LAAERIQPRQATGIQKFSNLIQTLYPKKFGTSLIWDIGYLLFLVFFEHTVIPWFIPFFGYIDFITPLITAFAVTQSYTRSVILGVVAGSAMESHMTIPAGTFICSYLVIINVLMIIRDIISWRQFNAWIMVSLSSILWVFLFETFVGWVTSDGSAIDPVESFAIISARLLFGFVFCIWLSTQVTLPDIASPEDL